MAVHNLYMGGPGPNGATVPGTYNAQMFPAADVDDNAPLGVDNRRKNVTFGIKRTLSWRSPADGPIINNRDPHSAALYSYLQRNPIAAGDTLRIILIPKYSELVRVWWSVESPVTGLDFNLVARTAFSGAGVTVPLNAAPISGAAVATGLIDVQAVNGGTPLYFDTNGVVDLEIVNMPAVDFEKSVISVTAVFRMFDLFGHN